MMSSKNEVPPTFCCTLHSLLKIGKMDGEEEGHYKPEAISHRGPTIVCSDTQWRSQDLR